MDALRENYYIDFVLASFYRLQIWFQCVHITWNFGRDAYDCQFKECFQQLHLSNKKTRKSRFWRWRSDFRALTSEQCRFFPRRRFIDGCWGFTDWSRSSLLRFDTIFFRFYWLTVTPPRLTFSFTDTRVLSKPEAQHNHTVTRNTSGIVSHRIWLDFWLVCLRLYVPQSPVTAQMVGPFALYVVISIRSKTLNALFCTSVCGAVSVGSYRASTFSQ